MSLMELLPIDVAHVAEVRHAREPVRKDGRWELVHLGEGQRLPSKARPRDARRLDAAEQGHVPHATTSLMSYTSMPGRIPARTMSRISAASSETWREQS